MDCYEFMTLYKENATAIQERIQSKELYDLYASFLGVPADAPQELAEKYLRSVQFFHFEDRKADEECVYGIGINHLKKRITVAFRGRCVRDDCPIVDHLLGFLCRVSLVTGHYLRACIYLADSHSLCIVLALLRHHPFFSAV